MPQWPIYVYMAADRMGYDRDEPEGVAAIEGFATRWGGFGPDALLRAVQAAEGQEWQFTMELLMHSAAQARELVAPGLSSSDPVTRWYTALYLGALQDQRALPVLSTMLTEFLPSPEEYQTARFDLFYEESRSGIAHLLGKMGNPACVPALRRALQVAINAARTQPLVQPDFLQYDESRHKIGMKLLNHFSDEIVYALGRLGAMGALTGLQGGEERIDLWRVHLIMGVLHGRYPLNEAMTFSELPELSDELSRLLTTVFGIEPADIHRYLAHYEFNLLGDTAIMFGNQQDEMPTDV